MLRFHFPCPAGFLSGSLPRRVPTCPRSCVPAHLRVRAALDAPRARRADAPLVHGDLASSGGSCQAVKHRGGCLRRSNVYRELGVRQPRQLPPPAFPTLQKSRQRQPAPGQTTAQAFASRARKSLRALSPRAPPRPRLPPRGMRRRKMSADSRWPLTMPSLCRQHPPRHAHSV